MVEQLFSRDMHWTSSDETPCIVSIHRGTSIYGFGLQVHTYLGLHVHTHAETMTFCRSIEQRWSHAIALAIPFLKMFALKKKNNESCVHFIAKQEQ